MIKKLIISAVILTALIASKESHAAGVGGFARALASAPAVHIQLAQNDVLPHQMDQAEGLGADKREELTKVNASVNQAIGAVDSYMAAFVGEAGASAGRDCFDCADIKFERLKALGWPQDRMRIAYAISAEGRIERVLVVSAKDGELVLGSDTAVAQTDTSRPSAVTQPIKATSLAI